jgi:RNA polymerase sigma-70 factor (ECF subfamily)
MTAHWIAPSGNQPMTPTGQTTLLDMAIVAHYEELCGSVRRRGHTPAIAREIVHDLYVRLRDRHVTIGGKRSLKAFLIRSCVNLGIDRLRRERFETRLFSGDESEALQVSAPLDSADQGLDLHHRLTVLKLAIMEMSLQRRRVFIASRVGKLSADEIAGRLNISRNMVDRHLRKAYLHCLARLEDTL